VTMTTPELLARLKRHYIKPGDAMPGGLFLPEVTHTEEQAYTGQRVDALYVGFFASRGHQMIGHELKISRADWLHELDNPGKSESWSSNCHGYILVLADASIIRDEHEVPQDWGIMVPGKSKTRMEILRSPVIHPERTPSWGTMHSVLKRIDTLNREELRIAQAEGNAPKIAAAVKDAERMAKWDVERLTRERDEARTALATLEQIGKSFAKYAVADALTSEETMRRNRGHLEQLTTSLVHIVENLNRATLLLEEG
jgi:hypothetical protein